jgi:hypothetical protein
MTPQTDIQFLARMVVATREGNQVSSTDARRLNNLAQFGDSSVPAEGAGETTLPEERRAATPGFAPPATAHDLVRG